MMLQLSRPILGAHPSAFARSVHQGWAQVKQTLSMMLVGCLETYKHYFPLAELQHGTLELGTVEVTATCLHPHSSAPQTDLLASPLLQVRWSWCCCRCVC